MAELIFAVGSLICGTMSIILAAEFIRTSSLKSSIGGLATMSLCGYALSALTYGLAYFFAPGIVEGSWVGHLLLLWGAAWGLVANGILFLLLLDEDGDTDRLELVWGMSCVGPTLTLLGVVIYVGTYADISMHSLYLP